MITQYGKVLSYNYNGKVAVREMDGTVRIITHQELQNEVIERNTRKV